MCCAGVAAHNALPSPPVAEAQPTRWEQRPHAVHPSQPGQCVKRSSSGVRVQQQAAVVVTVQKPKVNRKMKAARTAQSELSKQSSRSNKHTHRGMETAVTTCASKAGEVISTQTSEQMENCT